MSFMLTTKQVRDGSKTVTRRIGWWFLKPGMRVMACEKCQGLGKYGKIVKIREIEVVSTRKEPLNILLKTPSVGSCDHSWAWREVEREGFPGLSPTGFVEMFCEHMGCDPDTQVNRIEFKYVDEVKP